MSVWATGFWATGLWPAGLWAEAEVEDDDVPAQFTFNDASNAPLNTVVTSDPVTATGINIASAISVTGGEYNINGGAFVSTPGTVVVNDLVRARRTSSASNSTGVNVVVTIGGVSDTFTITTLALSSGTAKYMSMMGVG